MPKTLMHIGRDRPFRASQHELRALATQLAACRKDSKWKDAVRLALRLAEKYNDVADVAKTQKYAREAFELIRKVTAPPAAVAAPTGNKKKSKKPQSEKPQWELQAQWLMVGSFHHIEDQQFLVPRLHEAEEYLKLAKHYNAKVEIAQGYSEVADANMLLGEYQLDYSLYFARTCLEQALSNYEAADKSVSELRTTSLADQLDTPEACAIRSNQNRGILHMHLSFIDKSENHDKSAKAHRDHARRCFNYILQNSEDQLQLYETALNKTKLYEQWFENEPHKVDECFDEQRRHAKSLRKNLEVLDSRIQQSEFYIRLKDYEKALRHAEHAQAVCHHAPLPEERNRVRDLKSRILLLEEKHAEIGILTQKIAKFRTENKYWDLWNALMEIVALETDLNSCDDAYIHLREAIGLRTGEGAKLSPELNPGQEEDVQLYSFKANVGTRRVKEAIECGQKFIQLSSSSNRHCDRTSVAVRLIDLYIATRDYPREKLISHCKLVERLAKKSHDIDSQVIAYKKLEMLYDPDSDDARKYRKLREKLETDDAPAEDEAEDAAIHIDEAVESSVVETYVMEEDANDNHEVLTSPAAEDEPRGPMFKQPLKSDDGIDGKRKCPRDYNEQRKRRKDWNDDETEVPKRSKYKLNTLGDGALDTFESPPEKCDVDSDMMNLDSDGEVFSSSISSNDAESSTHHDSDKDNNGIYGRRKSSRRKQKSTETREVLKALRNARRNRKNIISDNDDEGAIAQSAKLPKQDIVIDLSSSQRNFSRDNCGRTASPVKYCSRLNTSPIRAFVNNNGNTGIIPAPLEHCYSSLDADILAALENDDYVPTQPSQNLARGYDEGIDVQLEDHLYNSPPPPYAEVDHLYSHDTESVASQIVVIEGKSMGSWMSAGSVTTSQNPPVDNQISVIEEHRVEDMASPSNDDALAAPPLLLHRPEDKAHTTKVTATPVASNRCHQPESVSTPKRKGEKVRPSITVAIETPSGETTRLDIPVKTGPNGTPKTVRWLSDTLVRRCEPKGLKFDKLAFGDTELSMDDTLTAVLAMAGPLIVRAILRPKV
ncbi:hypothetical protein SeMB42_g00929 [Synchytrium endobioticum]|uniref:Uncharacterized protein n=1 Tax=Synchytrium endobioticum TaxID=286115 RepID=A0A507DNC8_9FUNG|nr:hypothetical protein SeLEV6574_g05666 [Synchytrium endobioticum]TPX53229.1 hypothetical protein SeMB42_g00929 [Synchytrium endobioticum]